MNKMYVTRFSYFKSSPENPSENPALSFVDPLFKRRLSQISRMTIQVVHDVIDGAADEKNSKLVFVSFRGELSRQLKINKGLVQDAEVMPANFSISVFNTPPAVAAIALGMKAGYTAVFPGEDNFRSGFLSACAPVLCGDERKIIFVYADELVPEEYRAVFPGGDPNPLAFACVLSSEKSDGAVEINIDDVSDDGSLSSPVDFLEKICRTN